MNQSDPGRRQQLSGIRELPGRSKWIRTYRRFTKPSPDGLPNRRVLLAFPAMVLLVIVVLVGLGVNGSSSGYLFSRIHDGSDPSLIAGIPQKTRSDEWNIGAIWSIAQVQQGLPSTNESVPGGMDAALPQDLPRKDWSVAFRPHLLGFLFLNTNSAYSWKWWVPAGALIIASFVFFVTVLPRRPGVSALLALAFYFSPFFQWWLLPTTLWTVAWAMAVMSALVWATRSLRWRSRWVWSGVVGYLTVVMAMGVYTPFIVPVAVIAAAFGCVLVVERLSLGERWSIAFLRVVPLLLGGVVAASITLVFLAGHAETVQAFLGTAYPGNRISSTGAADVLWLAQTLGSSFTQALNHGDPGLLGANSSEASTFFYVGLYLSPVAVWAATRQRRLRRAHPWALTGLLAGAFILLAYLFVPGWDRIAHVLLLGLTTDNRVKIGLGLVSVALLVYLVRFLDDCRTRAGRVLATALATLFLLSQVAIAAVAYHFTPRMLQATSLWWVWALFSALSIYLFARRHIRSATVVLVVVAVAGSGLTNPLYKGILDLRQTPVAKTVMKLDDGARKAVWVGVGTGLTTDILLESGATAYNGAQGAPSRTMWKAIDPAGAYEFQWNRLASVNWVWGKGQPAVSNPAADQIMVTFDACATFAQRHVKFVLSDVPSSNSQCLSPKRSFSMPGSKLTIYQVKMTSQ